jgi:glycosyl-4,4'-diaponeurosporenoate acyltransferase
MEGSHGEYQNLNLPPIVLPGWAIGVLNVVIWVGWIAICGYLAHRIPTKWLDHDTWLTRTKGFESNGRLYLHTLKIHRWKDRLPELGAVFPGGFAKRSVSQGDTNVMKRFVIETRRAEYAHLAMMGAFLVTLLYNPLWADGVNLAFALVANLPCLLVQRYNRIRLKRVLRVS